ncbi:hypothetical protein D9M72_366860 [compost metagenome]
MVKVSGGVKGVFPLATSSPLTHRRNATGEPGLAAVAWVRTSMFACPAARGRSARSLMRATAMALYS